MFVNALYVNGAKTCVVEAQEIQSHVSDDGRDTAVAAFGALSDCDGHRLVFVREYNRTVVNRHNPTASSDDTLVRAHFRHDYGTHTVQQRCSDEEEEIERASERPTPCISNTRIQAMALMQQHFGTWEVSQWCCRRHAEARVWSPQARDEVLLNHVVEVLGWGRGTVRVPLAVLASNGSLSMAVQFAPSPAFEVRELPHCHLNPEGVIKAFATNQPPFTLRSLDVATAVCQACMDGDAQVKASEVRRGRIGSRNKIILNYRGQRFGPIPGDQLFATRAGYVYAKGGRTWVVVGRLESSVCSPSDWRIRVAVRLPHPFEISAHVRWGPDPSDDVAASDAVPATPFH
jgi:hypothetical protein